MQISGGKDAKDVKKMRSLMIGNLLFDGAIGLVPVFGDIADTIFKCNTRNAVLLENLLTKRARKEAAALVDSAEKLVQDRQAGTSRPATAPIPGHSSSSSSPTQRHDSPFATNEVVITGPPPCRPSRPKQYFNTIEEWLNRYRRGNRGERDVERAEGTSDPRSRV